MIYAHEQKEKTERYVGPRPGFPPVSSTLQGNMGVYLANRNLNTVLARTNGWYPSMYQGYPRIVIPCSNSAAVPYFQARDMSGKAELRYASPPAARDDSIVIVWPTDRAKGSVILEGPMCALAAADLGYVGIALMGNQPSVATMDYVAAKVRCFQPVLIVPDVDTPQLGPEVLSGLAQRGIPSMVMIPPRKDLGDMSPKERKRFLTI